jgi:predicted transposase YbfD/YdcC
LQYAFKRANFANKKMTNIAIFKESLKSIKDFRKPQGKRYELHNLLTIMVLAMLSGADDFESISLYCKEKSAFLESYGILDGKNYPSHDLFRWIMMHLEKSKFSHLLSSWLDSVDLVSEKRTIHIDGKVLRATRTSEHTRTALCILNAYCSENHITIGELLIDTKSCEKKAIPEIIAQLELSASVVTIDAIGAYPAVAKAIIEKKGDYILSLKKNNKLFFQDVAGLFQLFPDKIHSEHQTLDIQGVTKTIRIGKITHDFSLLPDADQWKNLETVIQIHHETHREGKIIVETRYYLTSLKSDSASLMAAIRRHWSIENQLHWHLDVAFNEDRMRLREKNAAVCMAVLRRFALALLKRSPSKESIKAQRLQMAWNPDHLFNLLKNKDLNIS